jgi:hypothetical protein
MKGHCYLQYIELLKIHMVKKKIKQYSGNEGERHELSNHQ